MKPAILSGEVTVGVVKFSHRMKIVLKEQLKQRQHVFLTKKDLVK